MMEEITLNKGQQKASDIVKEGGNLFLTGGAGVGKTFTTQTFINENTLIGCPTGAAAIIAGGSTNHRLFGMPIGVLHPYDAQQMSPETRQLLRNADRLVLDEVSMLRFDALGHIDDKLRIARECDEPFGGLQTIAVGDFYQLPTFVGKNEKEAYKGLYGNKLMSFESERWNFKSVELSEAMRNTNLDQLDILNATRLGLKKDWIIDQLSTLVDTYRDDLEWTHLCAFNADADKRNQIMYQKLNTEERRYQGIVKGDLKALSKECRVEIDLKLKMDQRVMIVANCPGLTYSNGSTGFIRDMMEDCIIVELDNSDIVAVPRFKFEIKKYIAGASSIGKHVIASLEQFPIVSGYALSIYKSQGSTLDQAVINLGKPNKYGLTEGLFYVAISRVKDLRNIAFARVPTTNDINVSWKVKKFYDSIRAESV